MNIYVAEDSKDIRESIVKVLELEGYTVYSDDNGQNALERLLEGDIDLALLDINMPERNGLEIAKELRTRGYQTPIIFLTARSLQENIWEGFESGADDYITKPFEFKELLMRINAVLQRTNRSDDESTPITSVSRKPIIYKNLELDVDKLSVKLSDIEISLNNKEFEVLKYLLINKGRVVSQEELIEKVWHEEIDFLTQTVRTNIKTLRKKIDPKKEIIKTKIGKGYVIE